MRVSEGNGDGDVSRLAGPAGTVVPSFQDEGDDEGRHQEEQGEGRAQDPDPEGHGQPNTWGAADVLGGHASTKEQQEQGRARRRQPGTSHLPQHFLGRCGNTLSLKSLLSSQLGTAAQELPGPVACSTLGAAPAAFLWLAVPFPQ